MSDEQKCPQCGTILPSGALAGLCPACLLQQGAATDPVTQPSAPFEPPALETLARLFPQLEILSLLGKGGMGAVYKARQPSLDRFVALKILAPQAAAGQSFEQRFTREARALARLSHPAIVGVHEFGETGGLHYFIMEYVDGLNLRQLQKSGRLSPREALQIVPQICDALQYAHDEGVVHRDIKPENVLIDRKGRVKIADFGLAKILGINAEALRLTGERHVMGTPHYMAPEQVEHPLEVDHRADIYSLGVVFYEMLTGELPLGKFAPPSRKVQVDVRLDDIVLRALEKEPNLRYQHVSEVKSQVETIAQPGSGARQSAAVSSGSTTARTPHAESASGKSWRWLSWQAAVVALVLGVILLVLLVVGAILLAIALPAYQKAKASGWQHRAAVATKEMIAPMATAQTDGTWIAKLPQGTIELIAVAEHPSLGKPWWSPDGSRSSAGPFENEGSHSDAQEDQQAREFVFRSRDLPADASSPTWSFDPSASWAGGGTPKVNGKPVTGYDIISASLPKTAQAVNIKAGVAMGAWETIAENNGVSSRGISTNHNGTDWNVTFLEAIEKADGSTVAHVTFPYTEQQTRLIAIDLEGAEHTASLNSLGTGGIVQLTATFGNLPREQIKELRFQVRPYHWVQFSGVALSPRDSQQKRL